MIVGDEVLLLGTQCSAYCSSYCAAVFWLVTTHPHIHSRTPTYVHIHIYMYIQNITSDLSLEKKELEREADHSPSSSGRFRWVEFCLQSLKCRSACTFVFTSPVHTGGSRYNSVDIATSYGLDGPAIESRRRRDFQWPSRLAPWSTKPPVQTVQILFPEYKKDGAWDWPATPSRDGVVNGL